MSKICARLTFGAPIIMSRRLRDIAYFEWAGRAFDSCRPKFDVDRPGHDSFQAAEEDEVTGYLGRVRPSIDDPLKIH